MMDNDASSLHQRGNPKGWWFGMIRLSVAVGSSIASVVWIFYFNISKRVKATFVH